VKTGFIKWIAGCFLIHGACSAELSFAPLFNDGAVLQCEMPVNVWGTADSGAKVAVSFGGQEKSAVASDGGQWQVQLDPLKASAEPHELKVSSSIGNQQSKIGNVRVGEVWLAGGQSNMAQPLKNSHNGADRLSKTIPDIHFVVVPQKTGLPIRQSLTPGELAWKSFSPETGEQIASTAFYFAEQIQQKTGRQVGIIQSSYGGTPCEAWTPLRALDAHPELKPMADQIRSGVAAGRSQAECEAEIESFMTWWRADREWQKNKNGPAPVNPGPIMPGNPWSSKSPAVLYENMIAPLIPYTTRGVIWYQGEANAGRPDEYRILFPAMIDAWRTAWNRPDWPFFFVQLAAYGKTTPAWKELCAAQTFTRDTVPHTGMALAIDCGEKNNIHPAAKQPVGERLARLALDQVYGQNIVSRGPAFQALEKDGSTVRVVFQCSDAGLKTSDGKAEVPGFELAGADGKFYPATARMISANTVEVASESVPEPASIRYAWATWPDPPVTLQNSAGLPAEPFKQATKGK
jgi:sialate O-acetylesterase